MKQEKNLLYYFSLNLRPHLEFQNTVDVRTVCDGTYHSEETKQIQTIITRQSHVAFKTKNSRRRIKIKT